MQNRLNKELQDLSANPPENCSVTLVGDDITRWRVDIVGPQDTPYAGGHFEVQITVPSNYPFRAPDANFQTRIYHPNVKSDDGSICADVFQAGWAPTLNIRYVIDTILSMITNPMPEHAVENDIAQEMLNNPAQYEANVRDWVQRYAQ